MVRNDNDYETIDYDVNNIDDIPAHGTMLEKENMDTVLESINEIGEVDLEHENEDSLLKDNSAKDDKDIIIKDDIEIQPTRPTENQELTIPADELQIIDTSDSDNLWRVIERKNNYNNELQYYNRENVLFLNDRIVITSKKEKKEDKNYTSGLVESNYGYLYGYYEFSIRLSYGKGIFPAIWFMPIEDISYPEIDVFEMIGSEPEIFYGVIHYVDKNNKKLRDYFTKRVEVKDSYKVALEWTKEEIVWYIDDTVVFRTGNGVPNQYMYIIINQAVGGNWPGEPNIETKFPSKFVIENIIIKPTNKLLRD